MLHLQKHPISFRHQWLFSVARFATTTASAASADPAPFAVEDYLVASCHLTGDKARKVSEAKELSHLQSPSKPDAVLAFLSGLGFSPHDIAAAVARYPPLLVCKVDKTLAPRLAALRDFGLSPSQISCFVRLNPQCSLRPITISKLQYYVSLFGSFDNVLRALNRGIYLLTADLERVVKPNVSYLRECGLGPQDVTKICISTPRLLYSRQESIREMVARAEAIGVPRGSPMFRHALQLVATRCKDSITAKFEFLKKAFQWSDAEVGMAVPKVPSILASSKDRLRCISEFLISEVGLDPAYIAHRPVLMTRSLERCLMPRYYVLKFLKAHRLLKHDSSYYTAVQMTEKKFMEKFIHPYTEAAPHLAEDYAAACRGEASTFRFQELRTRLLFIGGRQLLMTDEHVNHVQTCKSEAEFLEKYFDSAREKLPEAMASVRLVGREVGDLAADLSDLSYLLWQMLSGKKDEQSLKKVHSFTTISQELTKGVKSSMSIVHTAHAQLRQPTPLLARNRTEDISEKNLAEESLLASTVRDLRELITSGQDSE